MTKKHLPAPVIRRLSKYYGYLERLKSRRQRWVSSKQLAEAVGLTRSTVRMDISYLAFSGVCKRGYAVDDLADTLKKVLHLSKGCNVVLVGAGNMGRAIALHKEFARKGFQISGIFDSDPKLLNRKVGELVIMDMKELKRVIEKNDVCIGIIAVPPEAAQEVADKLVRAGVRGLLNLSCTELAVPKHVNVVEARLAIDLCELCCAVKMRY